MWEGDVEGIWGKIGIERLLSEVSKVFMGYPGCVKGQCAVSSGRSRGLD